MRSAALLAVALSLARRGRAPAPADLVTANNGGVGLMGQFDFAPARTVFAGSRKATIDHRPRRPDVDRQGPHSGRRREDVNQVAVDALTTAIQRR